MLGLRPPAERRPRRPAGDQGPRVYGARTRLHWPSWPPSRCPSPAQSRSRSRRPSTGCWPIRCPRSSVAGGSRSRRSRKCAGRRASGARSARPRTIATTDGGSMLETLTSNERPHSFGYTISDVRGPMKPLVASVDGLLVLRAGRHRHSHHLDVDPHAHRGRARGDAGVRRDVARLRPAGARGGRSHPAQVTDAIGRARFSGAIFSNRLGVWRSW